MNIVLLLNNGQAIATQIQSQADLLSINDRMNNGKTIVIGGSIYHGWDISRVMSEAEYREYKKYTQNQEQKKQDAQMRASGLWKCAYGYWHERYQECGHDLAVGGRLSSKIDGFIEYNKQPYDKEKKTYSAIGDLLKDKPLID